MALPNYPNNPTVGQRFTLPSGVIMECVEAGATPRWKAYDPRLDAEVMKQIASVDELRTKEGSFNGEAVQLVSYYAGSTKGGGVFVWDAASTAADDGGVTIAVAGVATGRWVRQLDGFVTPEMFGARGDGVSDDTQALLNGQSTANELNLPYNGSGTYVFDASAGSLNPQTTLNFSDATIKCATVDAGVDFGKTSKIFDIQGQRSVLSVTQSEFTKGVKFIASLSSYTGFIYIRSSVVAGLRWLSGSSSNIVKRECCYVTKGYLSDELIWDWAGDAGFVVEHEPMRHKLTLNLPRFELAGANIFAVINCERSNVTASGFTVTSGTTAPYTFIDLKYCSNFILDGVTLPDIGSDTIVSYLITIVAAYDTKIFNANNQTGWSSVNGNSFRKLSVFNSRLRSVGSHEFSYDINVENSTIYRNVTIHGGGVMRVRNVKHFDYDTSGFTGEFLSLRQDYGPHWDGIVDIDGLEVRMSSNIRVYNVFTDFVPENAHGYIQRSPQLKIRNINIKHSFSDPVQPMIVRALLLSGSTVTNLPDKILNDYLLVSDFTVEPEQQVVNPSNLEYRLVENLVSLATATSVNFKSDKIQWWFSGVINKPKKTLSSTNRGFFGVQTYNLSAGVVKQKIDISNSDYVGIRLTTPFSVEATISNQWCVSLYQKQHSLTSDLSSSIFFNGAKILSLNGAGTTAREINCTLKSCDVYHYSEFTGVNPATVTNLGFPDWGQIVDSSGSALHLPNFANDAVAAALKTRITTNYKDPSVFDL